MRSAALKVLCEDLAKSCERADSAIVKLDAVAPWSDPAATKAVEEDDDLFGKSPGQSRDALGQWAAGEGGGGRVAHIQEGVKELQDSKATRVLARGKERAARRRMQRATVVAQEAQRIRNDELRQQQMVDAARAGHLARNARGYKAASADNVVDLFAKYPGQPRDGDGQWEDEGKGTGRGGGKKPKGKKDSIAHLTRQFKSVKASRDKVRQQIKATKSRISSLKVRSPAHAKAKARLKTLSAQGTELTRQMKSLSDQVSRRRGKQYSMDWLQSMLAGIPVVRQKPRRGLKRAAHSMPSASNIEVPVDDEDDLFGKGLPEFNPNQDRDDGTGKWVAGSGTSARTERRRRQQAREAGKKPPPAKKPKAKPSTTAGKPKAPPKPKTPPKKPKAKPEKKPVAEKPPKAPRKPRASKPVAEVPVAAPVVPPVAVETPVVTPERAPTGLEQRDRKRLDAMYEQYDAAEHELDGLDARIDAAWAAERQANTAARDHVGGPRQAEHLAQVWATRRTEAAALEQRKLSLAERRNELRGSITALEARLRGPKAASKRFVKRSATFYGYRPLLNADEVAAWAKGQGFETTLDPEDMHVTVAYSRDPIDWPERRETTLRIKPASGSARGIQRLGKDGEAVVLRFESPKLRDRWQQFRDMGASWDHEGYKPHVTLTYRASAEADLQEVQPYEGELVFGPEQFEEVEEDVEHVEKMNEALSAVETSLLEKREPEGYSWQLLKADESLGLVFGWAIVSSEDGEPYYDTQGDHIPEDAMLNAATEFMLNHRAMKVMHAGKKVGTVVFAWPMTDEVAEAMGIKGKRTGLMIAVKPDNPRVLERFRNNEYTGFSIGGNRLVDEDVD